MKGLRIIIAGGRDFDNYPLLRAESLRVIAEKAQSIGVNKIPKEQITIISGKAKGADTKGEEFAKEFSLNLKEYPAEWNNLDLEPCRVAENERGQYNALAGLARNVKMAEYACSDLENFIPILIAFWDGKSKGTKHMIDTAKNKNMEVNIVQY